MAAIRTTHARECFENALRQAKARACQGSLARRWPRVHPDHGNGELQDRGRPYRPLYRRLSPAAFGDPYTKARLALTLCWMRALALFSTTSQVKTAPRVLEPGAFLCSVPALTYMLSSSRLSGVLMHEQRGVNDNSQYFTNTYLVATRPY